MKKTLLSSIILAGLIFSSCSNFLEETAYSSFDKEEAYSNPTLVYLNAVASVYTSMGLQGVMWDADFSGGGINYLSEYSADLGIVQGRRSDWVDGGVHQQIFLHSWTPSHNIFLDSWNYQYQVIGLCNASIDDLQAVLDEGGDDFLHLEHLVEKHFQGIPVYVLPVCRHCFPQRTFLLFPRSRTCNAQNRSNQRLSALYSVCSSNMLTRRIPKSKDRL